MKLKRLDIVQFRNLQQLSLEVGERFNIIHGMNAQGKTNLLESVYLLGAFKSFRLAKNADLIRWGDGTSTVKGWVERGGVTREILISIERHAKKAMVDRKQVVRAADFFGTLNVVLFTADEMSMAKGQPEGRRRYLDRAVFSSDPSYLSRYHDYGRILKHRNSLLKAGDVTSLDVWSDRLADAGARLAACRIAYIAAVRGYLRDYYRHIAGGGETADIGYRPHGVTLDGAVPADTERLREALRRTAREEQRFGSTVVGPHRDDMELLLSDRPLRQHASQGQQRSFLLALKMAEIEYLQTRFGDPPVLLLDDISSELDRERNRNLMEFLSRNEMQVFITTTNLDTIMLDDITQYRTFRIHDGKVVQ